VRYWQAKVLLATGLVLSISLAAHAQRGGNPQPVITKAEADLSDPDVPVILIEGEGFPGEDFPEESPVVYLGEDIGALVELTVLSATDTSITAELPLGLAPATYLVVVEAESGHGGVGIMDVTIGVRGEDVVAGIVAATFIDPAMTTDSELEGEKAARIADVDAEEVARIAADDALQADLDAEVGARTATDAELEAEETARIAEDDALQANLETEAAARIAADALLQSEIAADADADPTNELVQNIRFDPSSRQLKVDDQGGTKTVSLAFLDDERVLARVVRRQRMSVRLDRPFVAYVDCPGGFTVVSGGAWTNWWDEVNCGPALIASYPAVTPVTQHEDPDRIVSRWINVWRGMECSFSDPFPTTLVSWATCIGVDADSV
jgi:hypothetical protein